MHVMSYATILARIQDIAAGISSSGTPGFDRRLALARAVKSVFNLKGSPFVAAGEPVVLEKIAEFVYLDLHGKPFEPEDSKRRWFFITTCTVVSLDRIPQEMPDKVTVKFLKFDPDSEKQIVSEIPAYLVGYIGTPDEFAEFFNDDLTSCVKTAKANALMKEEPSISKVLPSGPCSPTTIATSREGWTEKAHKDFLQARPQVQESQKAKPENPDSAQQHFRRSLLVRVLLEQKVTGALVRRRNVVSKAMIQVLELWFWGEEMFQCEYTPYGPMIHDELFHKLEKVLGITK